MENTVEMETFIQRIFWNNLDRFGTVFINYILTSYSKVNNEQGTQNFTKNFQILNNS